MNRTSEYNKTKIAEISTGSAAMAAYIDSFDIEKVQIRFQSFEDSKDTITAYVSFPDFLATCETLKNRTLCTQLKNGIKHTLAMSNTKDKGIKSIQMASDTKGADGTTRYWINGSSSFNGENKKIAVYGDYIKVLGFFMMVDEAIRYYLPELFHKLKKEAENKQNNRLNNNGYYPDPPSYEEY